MTTAKHLDFGRETEARFVMDAQAKGFLVSVPFSSAPGYDAIVDTGKRLYRVQVKGCNPHPMGGKAYCRISVKRNTRTSPNFDVLAVWVTTAGRWAFLPKSTRHRTNVNLALSTLHHRAGWEIFSR